jgi:HD-like signal output (HDOD) protein
MSAILLVDDEQQILDGLRGLLRRERSRWQMEFVTSGAAALATLARQPYEVLVTDMRMPGMDGAELLTRVREQHPRMARLVLTGQASTADLVRALPVAQQIIAKPCERADLCSTIERSLSAQTLVPNPQVQALVGGLRRLPFRPECCAALSGAMGRRDVTPADIARIVEQDPALTLMTLSMANAASFGDSVGSLSVQVAVERIGFQLLRALAQSIEANAPPAAQPKHPPAAHLWTRALRQARLARQFVPDPALRDEAYASALLLNLGQIVLAERHGAEYALRLDELASSDASTCEFERLTFGYTHPELGAYLVAAWSLPFRLAELIAHHHAPAWLASSPNPLGAPVYAAEALTHAMESRAPLPLARIDPSIRELPSVKPSLGLWQSLAQTAA